MDARLVTIWGSGNGVYYTRCYWCHRSSPALDVADDLKLLAWAKASGWRCDRLTDGTHRLTCPGCRAHGQ